MPLELPNLDDRRYADLVAEARRLIPAYDPKWTNHNPSDPGITLVELFAYLTEMLLYRLDRVTADNQRKFLKLLNGPDWTPTPGADLNADIRAAVLAVRARGRAVTAVDFERLATEDFNAWLATQQRIEQDAGALDEWWQVTQLDPADAANLPSAVPEVARAACVPSRNLERGTEMARTAYAPAHVSLIILSQDTTLLQPSVNQMTALWGYLDERRTLTTRHHVVGPHYAPISAEIVIASSSGAVIASVRDRVLQQLTVFLDRLAGGATQDGWPFGRDIYVSELHEQIEAVEGVDYITDLMLFSECLLTDANCAAATPLWHAEGDLVGMALSPHHLPLARFDAASVVIAPNTVVVPVQLIVTLTAASVVETATLKRLAKAAVREFFHPLYQGPAPANPIDTDLMLVDLKTVVAEIAGVSSVEFELRADMARLLTQGGQVIGLHVAAGELVNLRSQVIVQTT